jgi:hypothetical protein
MTDIENVLTLLEAASKEERAAWFAWEQARERQRKLSEQYVRLRQEAE